MKVTVLVAVYNTAAYLPACLDSLINQTHDDLQIICIDDASTDNSLQILQEYASKDDRILVLAQSVNRGQAEARNLGLQYAEGEYVTMLDSDDWFASDAIEKACLAASSDRCNDCIVFDILHRDESTGREWGYDYRTDVREWSGEEAFRLSLDWSIHGLYMVRRSIHQAFPYDTTCRLYSDDNTTRLHYLHSRRVVRCEGIYYYRQHNASMTHAVTPLRFLYLDANYSMKQTLLAEGISDILINQYEEHRWLNIVGLYVFYRSNRRSFTAKEQHDILLKLRHFHATVEVRRLPRHLKRKFGYIPSPSCPLLFEWQNSAYLFVRKVLYTLLGKPVPTVV